MAIVEPLYGYARRPAGELVSLRNKIRGIGHTTPHSAAVVLADGSVLADSAHSPSLAALRTWLIQWEAAGRPTADSYPTELVLHENDLAGWDLRTYLPPPADQR